MTATNALAITVREAKLEDATKVSDLGRHVFSLEFGHTVTQVQLDKFLNDTYTPQAIAKEMQDPCKTVLVAVQNSDQLAGFAILTRASHEPCIEAYDRCIELLRLYVHTNFHGKGVGKSLAIELERIARFEGYRHMWLGVWEDNHNAQAVYRKLGYKRIGKHVFDLGGDLQTDHIMIKEL